MRRSRAWAALCSVTSGLQAAVGLLVMQDGGGLEAGRSVSPLI